MRINIQTEVGLNYLKAAHQTSPICPFFFESSVLGVPPSSLFTACTTHFRIFNSRNRLFSYILSLHMVDQPYLPILINLTLHLVHLSHVHCCQAAFQIAIIHPPHHAHLSSFYISYNISKRLTFAAVKSQTPHT